MVFKIIYFFLNIIILHNNIKIIYYLLNNKIDLKI